MAVAKSRVSATALDPAPCRRIRTQRLRTVTSAVSRERGPHTHPCGTPPCTTSVQVNDPGEAGPRDAACGVAGQRFWQITGKQRQEGSNEPSRRPTWGSSRARAADRIRRHRQAKAGCAPGCTALLGSDGWRVERTAKLHPLCEWSGDSQVVPGQRGAWWAGVGVGVRCVVSRVDRRAVMVVLGGIHKRA